MPPYGSPRYQAAPYEQQAYQQRQYLQPANGYNQQAGFYNPNFANGYVLPPKPGAIPLRPLGLADILSGAFSVLRRTPGAILGSSLILYTLIGLIIAGTASYATSIGVGLDSSMSSDGGLPPEVAAFGLAVISGMVLLAAVVGLCSVLLQGAVSIPVSRAALNRKTSLAQMWRGARGRIWAVVGFAVLTVLAGSVWFGLAVGILVLTANVDWQWSLPLNLLGMSGVFVGFLWIYIKISLVPSIIVVERLGIFASIKRSWTLTTHNWWRILGINLLTGLIVGVSTNIVSFAISTGSTLIFSTFAPRQSPGDYLGGYLIAMAATVVLTCFVSAFGFALQASVIALIYLDLRMRRDGLDVELMRLNESNEIDNGGVPGGSANVLGTYRAI
ncbi:hypothetical protein ACQQCD_01360 [Pseudarthrobacter sp. J1763]|uniref:hypothetical protein n=1 Tax=Pseudarthrobacter sp. J1763 TaxID=3420445 RepID=UPI003D2C303F